MAAKVSFESAHGKNHEPLSAYQTVIAHPVEDCAGVLLCLSTAPPPVNDRCGIPLVDDDTHNRGSFG